MVWNTLWAYLRPSAHTHKLQNKNNKKKKKTQEAFSPNSRLPVDDTRDKKKKKK